MSEREIYFKGNSKSPCWEKAFLLAEVKGEQAFGFLLRLGTFVLPPPLLPRVELGEAVANDGDGEANDEDAEDGAETAENFPKTGDWTHVSVSHLCKR